MTPARLLHCPLPHVSLPAQCPRLLVFSASRPSALSALCRALEVSSSPFHRQSLVPSPPCRSLPRPLSRPLSLSPSSLVHRTRREQVRRRDRAPCQRRGPRHVHKPHSLQSSSFFFQRKTFSKSENDAAHAERGSTPVPVHLGPRQARENSSLSTGGVASVFIAMRPGKRGT